MTAGQDMVAQLLRQLGFLERSGKLYDDGHDDEAIRIATTIRVLFHQTGNSTSLLSHLGAHNIDVFSSTSTNNVPVPTYKPGFYAERLSGLGWSRGRFGPRARTSARDCIFGRIIPAQEWWNEMGYIIDGQPFHRRDIVLAASNKDGGAHVDATLPTNYAKLLEAWTVFDGQSETTVTSIYAGLRTMAFEILNSPAIVALTVQAGVA